jgi:sialidase-1
METKAEQVDVFVAGADGVHTYRIPSLLVAPGGTLLAFCEARKQSPKDASPTDMVLKRSADGGSTWSAMQIVLAGPGEEAIMNPCPVVDGETVLLFCMNAHKTDQGRHRQLLLSSDDDGQTWTEAADITEDIAAGDDTFVPGPGVSIRLRGGRLVVPGYTNDYTAERKRTDSRSRVVTSDDHGQSWKLGSPVAFAMSNESQVVELADGSLMLNFRIQRELSAHPGCRGTAISRDGGQTWLEPVLDRALNDPVCQAGFVRYSLAGTADRNRLLFSNLDSHPGPGKVRRKMTVRLSYDEGQTWAVARLIDPGPAAYSCLAVLPDGRIALLYECGEESANERIRLARLSLEWLTEGKDIASERT